MAPFLWFNMSLASPGPSEDLEARSFAEASLFGKHMTPGHLQINFQSVRERLRVKNNEINNDK